MVINAGASRAILFIDLVEVSPTRTEIRTSGSLNLGGPGTDLNPSFTNIAGPGLNTNTDVLRFTPANTTVQGRYYSFTGPANPFTAVNTTCTNGNCLAAATPAAIFPVPFLFNKSTGSVQTVPAGSFWIADSYTSGSTIANSFFIDLSLAQIGLRSPTVTYILAGADTIVFREKVPGPLPILGAATAFSFSRRLRARILNASEADAEQSQQA
ncbi:MAG: hypothetical protein VKJ05_00045 [Synechococcaceae cyanobacterium]|nr:hypothetical protein [Synechococcaceae cyanobacterium]